MALVRMWQLASEQYGNTPSLLQDGFDGTLGPDYGAENAPIISGGLCSSMPTAMEFDGSDDLVTLPAGVHAVGNVLSISAWIKARDLNRRTIYSATTNLNQPHFGVSTNYGSGSLEVVIPGVFLVGSAPGVVRVNQWHHVAWTRAGSDPAQNQIYVDGVPVATSAGTATLDSNASNGWIGCRVPTAQHWNGWIRDLRIYSHAQSALEIYELFRLSRMDNALFLGQP